MSAWYECVPYVYDGYHRMRQKLIETQLAHSQQQKPRFFKYITRGWKFTVPFCVSVCVSYKAEEEPFFVVRLDVFVVRIQFVEGKAKHIKRYE